MLLAIDVGNTNISIGIFKSKDLICTWRISTDVSKTTDEYATLLQQIILNSGIKLTDINQACICSVVPPITATFLLFALRRPLIKSGTLSFKPVLLLAIKKSRAGTTLLNLEILRLISLNL